MGLGAVSQDIDHQCMTTVFKKMQSSVFCPSAVTSVSKGKQLVRGSIQMLGEAAGFEDQSALIVGVIAHNATS